MRRIMTRDGDTADLIALEAYGRTAGATEAILDANPHLAGQGPVFPAGLFVELPDVPAPAVAAPVRLWE